MPPIAAMVLLMLGVLLLRWGLNQARSAHESGAVKALSAAWTSALEASNELFAQLTPLGGNLELQSPAYEQWISEMNRQGRLDHTGDPQTDRWGNRYQLKVFFPNDGRAAGSVRCKGPDGVSGNEDDLVESFPLDVPITQP